MLPTDKDLISIDEAIDQLPRNKNGKKIFKSTVERWIQKGRLDANKERVRLDTIKVGGRRYTSPEALGAFARSLTGEKVEPTIPPNKKKTARSLKEQAKAARERIELLRMLR